MGQREVTPGGPLERSPPKGNDDNILSPRRRPRWAPARCPRQGPPASLRRGFLPKDPRLLLNNNISSPLCFEPQVAPAAPRIKSKPLTRALVTRPPIFSLALGSLVCPPSGPQVPAGPLLLHAVSLTPGLVPRGGAGETSREGGCSPTPACAGAQRRSVTGARDGEKEGRRHQYSREGAPPG